MELDAIVPAGGRASRLGGVPKPLLRIGETSLLQLAMEAAKAGGARQIVIVGPDDLPVPPGVLRTREDPPFGGPLAAVAAGLATLDAVAGGTGRTTADWLLVLASDQPGVAGLVPALLAGVRRMEQSTDPVADAVIGTDANGYQQYLAACYRRSALQDALAENGSAVAGGSMRRLVGGIGVMEVPLPAEAVGDVDTWDDAARWGLRR